MFSGKPCVTSAAHWQRSVPEQHGHPHQHEPRVPTHGVATATTAALAKQVAPTLLLFSFSLSLLLFERCLLVVVWVCCLGDQDWGGGGGGGCVKMRHDFKLFIGTQANCFRHDFKLFIGTQANCFRHDFKLFIYLWHRMSVYSAPYDPPHPPPPLKKKICYEMEFEPPPFHWLFWLVLFIFL